MKTAQEIASRNLQYKRELEKEIYEMQVLIDILWEFVSEKDVDKVAKKLRDKGL
jgi:hypothetical protein